MNDAVERPKLQAADRQARQTIVERIRTETIKALQASDVQVQLDRSGVNPMTSTPAELGKRISAETAVLAALIKELGIRAQ